MGVHVLEAVRQLLGDSGVPFQEVHHQPTRTSIESAEARGESLDIGGKALVLKMDDTYGVFVLRASRSLDSKALRQRLGVRKTRFATADELFDLTGLVPGSVPPFGEPILPFPLFVDESILENDRIAFNAGSLTDSIILAVQDYLKVSRPVVFLFSR